jgi:hypothetical protein
MERYLEQIHAGACRRQAIFVGSPVADAELGDEATKATVKNKEIHLSGFSGGGQSIWFIRTEEEAFRRS